MLRSLFCLSAALPLITTTTGAAAQTEPTTATATAQGSAASRPAAVTGPVIPAANVEAPSNPERASESADGSANAETGTSLGSANAEIGTSLGSANAEPGTSQGPSFDFSKPSISFQLGMIQPILLGGANVEADFRWGHLVIDYSHGWNLNLEGSAIVGEMKKQNVTMRVNYTTGLGIGYSQHVDSLRSFFELRFEPKLHRFEASYQSTDGLTKTAIAQYNTVTLGGGFYWTAVPFSHRKDFLRGLNISTSFRAWPKVASSLTGNEVAYDNKTTGQRETHKAANIGIADTPFFANISLGYIFQ